MRIEPLTRKHLYAMSLQPAQQSLAREITSETYIQTVCGGYSFAGLVDDKVLICAGILEIWKGRGLAWSLISHDAGPHMSAITRAAKRLFKASGMRRIEATCGLDFPAGKRWLQMLGFELETPVMRAYNPDGSDECMYVLIGGA